MTRVGMFQYTTRLSAEVEARFTSVERINQTIEHTPQETDYTAGKAGKASKSAPGPSWPLHGAVTFDDVTVRYRPGLEPVLKKLSFK